MNIYIETVTLQDGSKMDVIRDIEQVKKLTDIARHQSQILGMIGSWWDAKNGLLLTEFPDQVGPLMDDVAKLFHRDSVTEVEPE